MQGLEPYLPAPKAGALKPLRDIPVGLAGIGPASSRTPSARSSTDLQPVKSGSRESDPVSPRPERGGLPSSSNPWSRERQGYPPWGFRAPAWRRPESNRLITLAGRDRYLC